MKIRIENLGVVKQCEIDLSKKLTVFCGENGTGKTYVAYLIYGLMSNDMINISISNHNSYILNYIVENQKHLEDNNQIDILFNTKEFLDKNIQDCLQNVSSLFAAQNKLLFKNLKIETLNTNTIDKIFNSSKFKHNLEDSLFLKKEAGNNTINLKLNYKFDKNFAGIIFAIGILNEELHNIIYSNNNICIFPIERSSIPVFKQDIVINKIRNSNSNYSLPILDYLTFIQDLQRIGQKEKTNFNNLAIQIEENILHGNINIEPMYGLIRYINKRNKNLELDFDLSSSLVKNLAGLVIYLRHQAQENDLIIIDEPELNLHPKNQILLARIFAQMIRAGLRLIISTHSDYIIRELNNLIIIGSNAQVKQEAMADKGKNAYLPAYTQDEYLTVDDIGGYLFKFKTAKSKQVIVEEIPIDEFGMEVKTFDEAIQELNGISHKFNYLAYKDE